MVVVGRFIVFVCVVVAEVAAVVVVVLAANDIVTAGDVYLNLFKSNSPLSSSTAGVATCRACRGGFETISGEGGEYGDSCSSW